MLKKVYKYIKKEFLFFLDSFKPDTSKFLKSIGLDILLFFSIWLFVFELMKLVPSTRFTLTYLNLSMLIEAITIFLIYCFFKSSIYNILLEKRYSLNYYLRFTLLTLVWSVVLIMGISIIKLIEAILFGGQPITGAIFILTIQLMPKAFTIIIFYLAIISLIFLANKNNLLYALKQTWSVGIKKIKYFIIPGALIILVFNIANLILLPFRTVPRIYLIISSLLVLTVFLAWTRLYLLAITKKVAKKAFKQ